MTTSVAVLSPDQQARAHEAALATLARVGVRVDSGRARRILAGAGAVVRAADARVTFPRDLVEHALSLAPRTFTLGGRRPGWSHPVGEGACTLVVDGEAMAVWDAVAQERRPPTIADWEAATRVCDALDEVGVYWRTTTWDEEGAAGAVSSWRRAFGEFGKHVQDAALDADEGRWLLEVLQVVFGGREEIATRRPFSFLLCPHTPLVLEGPYTDAYLEVAGWGIPVAAMPMPIMGLSSPSGLLATVALGHAEVLATLCLVQAADPGTPFISAPALAVMQPRSGRYGGGAVEHALLGVCSTEMARHVGLPVEASTGGTDHHVPGIQAAYERAINWSLPALAWPDLLVGPGMLGGSTILSLEQLVLDVEVFRRCRRLHAGVASAPSRDLDGLVDLLARVGPGGDFLAEPTTRDGLRAGEWYLGSPGFHEGFERWEEAGRPDILVEARDRIDAILAERVPDPLPEDVDRELGRIEARARDGRPPRRAASRAAAPTGTPAAATRAPRTVRREE
jgi:trimethylamine--corrinoid protein Co-methyltransferase